MTIESNNSKFRDNFLLKSLNEEAQYFGFYSLKNKTRSEPTSLRSFCFIPYKNSSKDPPNSLFYEAEPAERVQIRENKLSNKNSLILKSGISKSDYLKNIRTLKEQIQQGNIYEVNYCMEFFAENVEIDPVQIFIELNKLSKAPYSSLVKMEDDFIICASPELFLKKEGNKLFTKPIKGTERRGNDVKEDEELKNKLFNSVKERTENVMAVDVARNDLSIIAKRGTVNVNKLYNIESYETVHQMVSTVSCELKEGINFENIIEATFPMASMTGAPKISAMNLIDEFESFERKNYSGAMGIIDQNGDFELNVIIRSIFYNQKTKRLSIAVGSAITHLCEPEAEYDECLLKAKAMLSVLNASIE